MGKLRPKPLHKVLEILRKNGFVQVRSGKHLTFKKVVSEGKTLTTWVPHHKEITVFVQGYIMKQTGKPKEEFL